MHFRDKEDFGQLSSTRLSPHSLKCLQETEYVEKKHSTEDHQCNGNPGKSANTYVLWREGDEPGHGSHSFLLDFRKHLIAGNKHGIHVGDGATWRAQKVTFSNLHRHFLCQQHSLFHRPTTVSFTVWVTAQDGVIELNEVGRRGRKSCRQ